MRVRAACSRSNAPDSPWAFDAGAVRCSRKTHARAANGDQRECEAGGRRRRCALSKQTPSAWRGAHARPRRQSLPAASPCRRAHDRKSMHLCVSAADSPACCLALLRCSCSRTPRLSTACTSYCCSRAAPIAPRDVRVSPTHLVRHRHALPIPLPPALTQRHLPPCQRLHGSRRSPPAAPPVASISLPIAPRCAPWEDSVPSHSSLPRAHRGGAAGRQCAREAPQWRPRSARARLPAVVSRYSGRAYRWGHTRRPSTCSMPNLASQDESKRARQASEVGDVVAAAPSTLSSTRRGAWPAVDCVKGGAGDVASGGERIRCGTSS